MRRASIVTTWLAMAISAAATGCAPAVDAPADRQRAADRDDSAALAHQLAALPGALTASATLRRPIADPLAPPAPPAAASAAILVTVDDHADRSELAAAARRLVRGAAPEVADPQIVVEVGAPHVELARVGPFEVAAHSRRGLLAALVIAAAAISMLGLALAYQTRRRP